MCKKKANYTRVDEPYCFPCCLILKIYRYENPNLYFIIDISRMLAASLSANACTGITLNSKNSTTIVARTIEWGGSDLNSQYVIVPRGYTMRSYTPDGSEECSSLPGTAMWGLP